MGGIETYKTLGDPNHNRGIRYYSRKAYRRNYKSGRLIYSRPIAISLCKVVVHYRFKILIKKSELYTI